MSAAGRTFAVLGLTLVLGAADALAVPAVFTGDPVNGLGKPWVILPGVPLLDPGDDGKFLTDDDVIDPGTVGDVDVVARTGGTYTPGSGVIPPPAASVAAAPGVVAGGTTLLGSGTEVAWQLVASDGATTPAAGNPQTATDLDGRGALALAYADLDGDGFIGQTSADPDGSTDDETELQEAWTPVGRRFGIVSAGLASGTMAVETALPASKGGLGIVLAGGIITGAASPLFLDGPWVATLLPCMWPPDITEVTGENPGAPDPLGLVDLEYEIEAFYCPPANDPVIGTPLAIPLDGSSISNDLARATSGAAEAPGLASPVPAGFVAAPMQRLRPLVSATDVRTVAVPLGAQLVSVPDDGPGGAQTEILVFPADRLGNQADVPLGGSDVTLEVSSNLRIVSPDTDSNPLHETITFAATGYASVVLDDAGAADDGGATGSLVASLDGTPGAALRITLGDAPTTSPLGTGKSLLRFAKLAGTDRATVVATVPATPALDFGANDVTITLLDGGVPLVSRTLAAGSLTGNKAGTAWRYRDPKGVTTARIGSLSIRRQASTGSYVLRTMIKALDLSDFGANIRRLTVRFVVGSATFQSDLDCTENSAETATSCVL